MIVNTQQYIKEKAVYLAVKSTVNTFSSDSPKDTGEIFKLFNDACNISLIDDLGFDYLNKIDEHIADIKVVDRFIPTGYTWLNRMLGGGWLEGGRALYMFMGATNVGKSIVLGNVAKKMLEIDRVVLLITLEMSQLVYSKRISTQLSRIPFAKLRAETDALATYLKKFKEEHPNSRLIVKEFPPSSITPNNIKAYVKQLVNKMKVKPDAVVLDYLTLLLANTQSGSMYSDGKAIAEQVRALSYPQNFGCPIITAGQINRSGFGEANPDLDKSGESIAIPQTADASFSLWQSEAEKELGVLNCGIRKKTHSIHQADLLAEYSGTA